MGERDWIDYATILLAGLAFPMSVLSLILSGRTQRLAERQDARRVPNLALHLLEGYRESSSEDGARIYSFNVRISNVSDSDNAIAAVELRIVYVLEGEEMVMRLPIAADGGTADLTPPIRIPAHETVAGWCRFRIDLRLLEGRQIEGYNVEIRDTHGSLTSIEPKMVMERNASKTESS